VRFSPPLQDWNRIPPPGQTWDYGYEKAAFFMIYVARHSRTDFALQLNQHAKDPWTDNVFVTLTNRTGTSWWAQCAAAVLANPATWTRTGDTAP
jgi:hypothetical protein